MDPRGRYLGSAGIGNLPAVGKMERGRAEGAGVAPLWVRWREVDLDLLSSS